MSGTTLNLPRSNRDRLEQLGRWRKDNGREPWTMAGIMTEALDAYLATPAVVMTGAPRRPKLDDGVQWWYRLPDELEQAVDERALIEVGAPKAGGPAPGAPGYKSFRASVMRNALDWYLERLPNDEREGMFNYLNAFSQSVNGAA